MADKLPIYDLELDYTDSGVYAVSMVDMPAIMVDFVALSQQEKPEHTIFYDKDGIQAAYLAKQTSPEKHELTGPVLIPELLIFRTDEVKGDYYIRFKSEIIEQTRNRFMQHFGNQSVTHQHMMGVGSDAFVAESWIITDAKKDKSVAMGFDLPVGTWMMTIKVNNQDYWDKEVKAGKVKGFSIEGIFTQIEVKAAKKKKPTTDAQKAVRAKRRKRFMQAWAEVWAETLGLKKQKKESEDTNLSTDINLMDVYVEQGGEMVAITFPEEPPYELAITDSEGTPIGTMVFVPEEVAEPEEDINDEELAAQAAAAKDTELAELKSQMADLVKQVTLLTSDNKKTTVKKVDDKATPDKPKGVSMGSISELINSRKN